MVRIPAAQIAKARITLTVVLLPRRRLQASKPLDANCVTGDVMEHPLTCAFSRFSQVNTGIATVCHRAGGRPAESM
jgi:hypothetical protein